MKWIYTVIFTAVLGGCVSDSEFAAMHSRVGKLNSKVNNLENDLVNVKEELAVVKGQRVVRLPTGAPTATQNRRSASPAYQLSAEDKQYNEAVERHQSGDAQGAISLLEQFNSRYPNAKKHAEVLFYLGQANYTIRDYIRAQQVLEELIYQTPPNAMTNKASSLLMRVYQAQNNSQKANELKGFMDQSRLPAQNIQQNTQDIQQKAPALLLNESSF